MSIRPIAVATDGFMNSTGISPLSQATDGYLNLITVRTIITGGGKKKKIITTDDDEVLEIIRRIFGGVA